MTTKRFSFGTESITTVKYSDNVWFKGKEIAGILGYHDTDQAIRNNVDPMSYPVWETGQDINQIVIKESGVYTLIFGSRLESARTFKRRVTSEVLPSISHSEVHERTGAELAPNGIVGLNLGRTLNFKSK